MRTARTRWTIRAAAAAMACIWASLASAQQPIHEAYTRRMRETLPDPRISTEFVTYMPYSPTVPTPLEVLGTIIGEPGVLHRSAEIYRYFDILDEASPRVKV